MANHEGKHEENHGAVNDNHLHDGDKGMQVVQDQLDYLSLAIAALKGRIQARFGDINARFDDFITRVKALRLHTNMNRGKRKAHDGNEAHNQPLSEPIHANPNGQYDYRYSYDEEDPFWLIEGTNNNHKEKCAWRHTLGRLYLRPIPKIPPKQQLVNMKGIEEDELGGGC
ncbi:hypothetical protein SADUNF_Sadunf10G0009400 [Salix dunnii]|uniref:Uncharacterized protein n=1 Tax=Salix dunnii TaxID=1413687 RepID=A0A835MTW9_9ROSI|nr:hypothetical protein SADUNF_Sadunf10G0009400 [Salix dunnii]